MSDSLKSICTFLIIVALFAAFFGWVDDRPNQLTWGLRIGGPALFAGAILVFLAAHYVPDDARDFLLEQFGNIGLDRNGFTFVIVPQTARGMLFLDMYFQNRFEGPCAADVHLRPFRSESHMLVEFHVSCGPGAFGIMHLPVAVPRELQGQQQEFEVGANVSYPQGRGRMLRARRCATLTIGADFKNVVGELARIGSIVTLDFVLHPAILRKPDSTLTMTLSLPRGVATMLPKRVHPELELLWSLDQSFLAEPPLVRREDQIE
jgi:hypothetical protein